MDDDISIEELKQIARTVDDMFFRDLCDCDTDAKDNCELCTCGLAWVKRDDLNLEEESKQQPTAIDALQAIANLPTGRNEDIINGHEDAYRAIEQLFEHPPTIICEK